MTDWHASFADIRSALDATSSPFSIVMRHGTMSVELFEPDGEDLQTPHLQDEIYIIRSGSATFRKEGETVKVKSGDILFVEAGADHRFADFDGDFSTWVVFWGPNGGEEDHAR